MIYISRCILKLILEYPKWFILVDTAYTLVILTGVILAIWYRLDDTQALKGVDGQYRKP